jgi:hypothetical protein
MTVNYVWCVFGFVVKIEDYIALYGYDKIPDDVVQRCKDIFLDIDDVSDARDVLMERGGIESFNGGDPHWDDCLFVYFKRFQQGRYHYITTSFPEDHDKRDTHYIVGIEKPEVDLKNDALMEPYPSNQLMADEASEYAVYRLAQCNIPYGIVRIIMQYLRPDDTDMCNALLEDKGWKRIITTENNKKLRPKMYMLLCDN